MRRGKYSCLVCDNIDISCMREYRYFLYFPNFIHSSARYVLFYSNANDDTPELGTPPTCHTNSFGSRFVPSVATRRPPAAPPHAEDVQLLGPAIERVAPSVGAGRPSAQPPGGGETQVALPPGGHLSRGASHPSHAAVSRRDECAEDLRRHPGDVPQDVTLRERPSVILLMSPDESETTRWESGCYSRRDRCWCRKCLRWLFRFLSDC